MMSGEVTDNHKVVFMFEFVKKVNEINSNKEHFSSNCIIRNLCWRIVIERKSNGDDGEFEYVDLDSKDTLAVKLNCAGTNTELWCSYAKIRLTLVSQKEGVESFSREFENLFSKLNPTWGYSEFIEWNKVIDPENGFVKNNILKFQAYVVADIPGESKGDDDVDTEFDEDDWLTVFENNLNDKIVGRISTEFIRMNTVIEKAVKNEEVQQEIVGAAVNSISTVIRTEIQALEKKLEKSCMNHITKVIREIKSTNVKEHETSNQSNNLSEKMNSSENETHAKKLNIVEEETVPVSALKIMKELIVEQQRTSFGWMPSLYGSRAAYYRTNELHSYQPDPIRESEEFRLQKGALQPLVYECGPDSNRQSGDQVADKCWEMKTGSVSQPCETVQQHSCKIEKNEEIVGNTYDSVPAEFNKTLPTVVLDENEVAPSVDQSDKKLLFFGKNSNGDVEVHKIADRKQLLNLTKKYKNYKIWGEDEF